MEIFLGVIDMRKNILFGISFFLLFIIALFADTDALFSVSTKYNQSAVFGGGIVKLSGEYLNQVQYNSGSGTDSKQIDFCYSASGTVTSATPVLIDMASLTDFRGESLSINSTKIWALKNTSSVASLSAGGTWLATQTIEMYGSLIFSSPLAGRSISSTTSQVYLSTPSSATYEIFIAGLKN